MPLVCFALAHADGAAAEGHQPPTMYRLRLTADFILGSPDLQWIAVSSIWVGDGASLYWMPAGNLTLQKNLL